MLWIRNLKCWITEEQEKLKKLPPNRVGANFDHSSHTDANWLPSFGRVWNSGRRWQSRWALTSAQITGSFHSSRRSYWHFPPFHSGISSGKKRQTLGGRGSGKMMGKQQRSKKAPVMESYEMDTPITLAPGGQYMKKGVYIASLILRITAKAVTCFNWTPIMVCFRLSLWRICTRNEQHHLCFQFIEYISATDVV